MRRLLSQVWEASRRHRRDRAGGKRQEGGREETGTLEKRERLAQWERREWADKVPWGGQVRPAEQRRGDWPQSEQADGLFFLRSGAQLPDYTDQASSRMQAPVGDPRPARDWMGQGELGVGKLEAQRLFCSLAV